VAKNEKISVNGYTIPSGKGGVAVRRACEIIVKTPGIKQTDLLDAAAAFSRLNHSTAAWVTSPGQDGKPSPASCLWERRKEGRNFHCYPNEFTEKVGDSELFAIEELIKEAVSLTRQLGNQRRPSWIGSIKPGDLVRAEPISSHYEYTPITGIFLGWSFDDGQVFDTPSDISGRLDSGAQFAGSIYPVVLSGDRRLRAVAVWIRAVGP